jgi:NAD dependent epimerase/dehydratase family enzyme
LLKIVYGQMASEILLSSCGVATGKLTASGFIFRHPTLDQALRRLLGKERLGTERNNMEEQP